MSTTVKRNSVRLLQLSVPGAWFCIPILILIVPAGIGFLFDFDDQVWPEYSRQIPFPVAGAMFIAAYIWIIFPVCQKPVPDCRGQLLSIPRGAHFSSERANWVIQPFFPPEPQGWLIGQINALFPKRSDLRVDGSSG